MLKFEWSALRVGHRVVVHDQMGTEFPLLAGIVAMHGTKRSNDSCWRRAALAETAARHLVASAEAAPVAAR